MMKSKCACFFFVGLLLLWTGCGRGQVLENDPEACALLAGSWRRTLSLETSISSGGETSAAAGIVASNAVTTLTLNADQSFSIESRQEFVSYIPVDASVSFDEEMLGAAFSSVTTVQGIFVANKNQIQLDHQSVAAGDSSTVPFEEFSSANPQAGEKIQTVAWRLDGDLLHLVTAAGTEPVEAVYTRVAE